MTEIHQRLSATPSFVSSAKVLRACCTTHQVISEAVEQDQSQYGSQGSPAVIGFQLDFVLLIFAAVTCLDPLSYQEESIVMPLFLMPCKVCPRYCRPPYQTFVLSR